MVTTIKQGRTTVLVDITQESVLLEGQRYTVNRCRDLHTGIEATSIDRRAALDEVLSLRGINLTRADVQER
jgi:hypothetical protein